ncbi:hypothetical protein ABVB69_38910 [Streptomyces sp. NPDC000349]|uniref:hypothetical protein n=1 Tax=unclassified Streptomyces TaxID=2593676 RepID=UPI002784A110|nr:hypothetical protein [Streptomyces sp. DSM 40167]MDQ0408783.1 hypothetical protein [Streptomyces sp. DSM 40167]
MPEVVALYVYADYQQRFVGWPQMPPGGLLVALHPENVRHRGLARGQNAVLVELNVPQDEAGPSRTPVPSFLADPTLDLTDTEVRAQVRAAGVSTRAYEAAMPLQDALLEEYGQDDFGQDEFGQDEFGQDAMPSSQYAGQDIGYSALSFHAPSGYTARNEAGPSSMNPSSAYYDYAQYPAHPSSYGQPYGQGSSYAGGMAEMTQGMQELTVAAATNPYAMHAATATPDPYATSRYGGQGGWPPGVAVSPYTVNPIRGADQYNAQPANTPAPPTSYQPAHTTHNTHTSKAKGPRR